IELCGGTHVKNTAEIGSFFITKESGVSSGVRRIEAVCGMSAVKLAIEWRETLEEAKAELKAKDLLLAIEKQKDEIKRLKEELKKANFFAKTDELTNIPNRRGFNENIEEVIQLSLQSQQPFALVILDLDLFKKVNDTFGHIVGDSALRYVSKLLKEETKGRDCIARIGGEEFSIILPDISYENAIRVADNIRKKIASKTLSVKGQTKPLRLTLSSGVAIYRKGEEIETLFQRADEALYLAKNNGRNQVCGEQDL
ncbi:MAG: diguanylate cyclase, partial [Thiomicrorhabdus sp.]|nr:diguanylate cyclase [Thiomicrorhabdus sp.]